MKKLTLAIILAFTIPAFAQDVVSKRDQQLTEVEQLKIQIANLQIQLRQEQTNSAKWIQSYGECQTTLLSNNAPVNTMLTNLEKEIEKEHVGFDFDIKTGEFKVLKPSSSLDKKQ